jgi:hypothetical protein
VTDSGELRRGAELLALTGLAVVQPLLDVFGKSPETFVFRGVDGGQLVLFGLLVTFLPAAVLWLIGLATRVFGPKVRAAVHVGMVAALAGLALLVALQPDGIEGGGALVLLLAIGAGAGAAVLYVRFKGIRLFLLYLAPLPVLACGLFLFTSDVSGLVDGGDVEVVAEVPTTRSVVMLLLDEFPTATILGDDGLVDAEEFPNLARLSEQSTWYRNYTTHNAGTVQAVPSLLSGQLPTRGRAPLVTDWPTNLFTLLGGSYEMAVQEAVTQLCPPDVCGGGSRSATRQVLNEREGFAGIAGDAVDVYRDLVSLNGVAEVQVDQFTEEVFSVENPEDLSGSARDQVANQPGRFTSFLDGMAEGEEPTLHFAHLILPHGPWRFFPDGTEYESPDGDPEGEIVGVWTRAWPTELTQLRLELQARYTDALVGETIARMRETGLWQDSLFVVVADHGGAFVVDSPGRALADDNVHEVMWTPLFIRSPGLPHGVDDTDVEATDLLPTMAELLDIDLPYEVDGASAISSPDTSGSKRYMRLQNPFQLEPDALLDIDTDEHLADLLDDHWPDIDVDDPVGAFYRRYPLGSIYGEPVGDVAVGDPAGSASVDQLEPLTEGTDGPLPAYVGGSIDVDGAGEDTWVVLAVDGVVEGFSKLFPMVDTDAAFSVLLDQDVVAGGGRHEIELFVTTGPGAPLRPLDLDG